MQMHIKGPLIAMPTQALNISLTDDANGGYYVGRLCPSTYITFDGTAENVSLHVPKFVGALIGNAGSASTVSYC